MNALRLRAVQAAMVILAIVLVLVLVLQCRDFESASEIYPATGFAVLLSFGSVAMSWSRMNPPLATFAEVKRVKRAGLDLLIASALTLGSACFLRLAQDSLLKGTSLAIFILLLHILSLALGLFLGWVGLLNVLNQAISPASDLQSDASA